MTHAIQHRLDVIGDLVDGRLVGIKATGKVMKQDGIGASTHMHKRVLLIIIVLGLFNISIQGGAIQSEGPTKEPPDIQTINQTNSISPLTLNIEVASDVYSDKDSQVLCCPKGNFTVVRNRIYLVGPDLDKIKEAKYILHETFDRPEGILGDPANDFEIWIWSWGGFLVRAVITTKNGETIERDFDFSFKSKFE